MYYAELDTDKYIRESFFPDFSYKGTMVEVGAGPPVFYSISKHFRDFGWRCICIEPNPKFVEQHKKLNNEIYNVACSFEEKDSIFNIVDNTKTNGWDESFNNISFSSLGIKYEIPNFHESLIKKIPVKVVKLDSLLNSLNIQKIDFLSVDTEGWEIEVMMGFNAKKYDPKVVILENYLYLETYVEYMETINYHLHRNIDYNYIFLKNE
jgi:FkbM family methyltransferase